MSIHIHTQNQDLNHIHDFNRIHIKNKNEHLISFFKLFFNTSQIQIDRVHIDPPKKNSPKKISKK